MTEKEKKEEFKQSDIEAIAVPAVKLLIVCCLPWILFSKLDKHFDRNSEEGFERWNFYWSFPATHLSWLALTLLFGLPLLGLLGAPVVLPVCIVRGTVDVSLSTTIIGAIVVVAIWVGLYWTARHYRSDRELREVRKEVYREEGDLNEA